MTELATQVPANREEFAQGVRRIGAPTQTVQGLARVGSAAECRPGASVSLMWSPASRATTCICSPLITIGTPRMQCFVASVSELTAPLATFEQSVANAQWSTVFETTPCIPLEGPDRKRGKNPFRGEEIGGEMVLLEGNKLLLDGRRFGFQRASNRIRYSRRTRRVTLARPS